jgi:diguanylate cyclase (GGDEF)-like protein/putative nucleotidyltransferase with HDIG domain
MLLGLVYGVFLVLVGVTATALVAVATVHQSNSSLASAVARDHELVELFVTDRARAAHLGDGDLDATAVAELESWLATLASTSNLLRVEIRDGTGDVAFASAAGLRGEAPGKSAEMAAALAGTPSAGLLEAAQLVDPAGPRLEADRVIQQYLPVLDDAQRTLAVIALWRDAGPVLAVIAEAQRDIVLVTLAAAAILAAILFLIFRAAQKRIARQHAALLEAERRDPLTGLLNHGAVVTHLAEAVEDARLRGGCIGLALVDVDNFKLLNDTHGHEAGDDVLLRVAAQVERVATAAGTSVARYGPDEFLVLQPGAGVREVRAVCEQLIAELAQVSVRFGESEQLPVSVSIGICALPDHASAVTDLLSEATVALAEAKASGGETICVARRDDEEEEVASGSFDVLQGLILAVDTKDRYTKRHSEDVARYAVFLAERLGLDAELVRAIHLAGLLHDVGKIGIPDSLLRKPGRLTAEEFDVFKQHVALGDAIVRDVPRVELVRAGIRHHHERWDGRGYLDGLEGEEIPLIGRVLAVADAFSAMTTTRPYRKALPLEEALKRLGDAAGAQLQEDLVTAFIAGIETAPDAPLPGDQPAGLWRPQQWVA